MKYAVPFLTLAVWIVAAAAAGLAGCGRSGPAEANVHGSVAFDGKPLEKGTITFLPSDGKGPTAGGEIKDGQYSFRVPPGPKRIEVRSPKTKAVVQRKVQEGPQSPAVSDELIPAIYNRQSTLRKEVQLPETRIDLDLKPAPLGARR